MLSLLFSSVVALEGIPGKIPNNYLSRTKLPLIKIIATVSGWTPSSPHRFLILKLSTGLRRLTLQHGC